MSLLLNIY